MFKRINFLNYTFLKSAKPEFIYLSNQNIIIIYYFTCSSIEQNRKLNAGDNLVVKIAKAVLLMRYYVH